MARQEHPSFGEIIAAARRRAGLNQRDAAKLIKKKDGEPISVQYLSEIENDHRNIPSNHLIDEIARAYKVSREYLYYQAGRLTPDLPKAVEERQFAAAYRDFRKRLKEPAAA